MSCLRERLLDLPEEVLLHIARFVSSHRWMINMQGYFWHNLHYLTPLRLVFRPIFKGIWLQTNPNDFCVHITTEEDNCVSVDIEDGFVIEYSVDFHLDLDIYTESREGSWWDVNLGYRSLDQGEAIPKRFIGPSGTQGWRLESSSTSCCFCKYCEE